jgi:hypothetical protein
MLRTCSKRAHGSRFCLARVQRITFAKQHSLDTVDPNRIGGAKQHLPVTVDPKIVNSFNKKLTK